MVRVIVFLLVVLAAASGLAWLADRPGNVVINWEGYEVQVTVFSAVVALAILLLVAVVVWSLVRGLWQMPAGVGNFFNRRREKRGLEALSSGLIAIGAGDKSLATRYAVQARKSLPNEPLTHILRAQAAQLTGDRATSRRIYEAMLASPDTEPLGLRGLYLEAQQEGETEAARQFAERAMKLNPKLSWPVHSLFDMQCKAKDWAGAIETLTAAKKHGHVEKAQADRRRAVLLTAQAQVAEESDPETAMKLAEEAHGLAPDLVPATAIAGRLLAARGNVQKAAKILQKGWRKGPHPDIATAYAFARIGDSPKDRLTRVKQLAGLSPHSPESVIAVATAAIDAKDFAAARDALTPMIDGRLSQRICTLMARIESEDGGNTGAVREWLARAVNAPRDPAWTADGVVADDWAPVSPITGALDAFEWRVPVESVQPRDAAILSEKIEELVKLGARADIDPEAASKSATIIGSASTVAGAAAAAAAVAAAAPPPAATEPPPAAQPAPTPVPVRDAEDAEIVDLKPEPVKAAPATVVVKPAPSPEVEDAETPVAGASKPADSEPVLAASAEKKTFESDTLASADDATETAKAIDASKREVRADVDLSDSTKADDPAEPMQGQNSRGAPPEPKSGNTSNGATKAQSAVFVSPRPPDDPGADNDPDVLTPSPAYAGPRRKY